MSLISMKRQPSYQESPLEALSDEYGYGLCLHLDKQQCAALGLTALPAPGTPVMIRARCIVTRTEVVNDGDSDDPENNLNMQITDLEIDSNGGTETAGQAATLLYGG